ncbi:RpiB/LacA/LacB family sugar-phosphate isomerase [Plebeiibacterium marinum]
MEMVIGLASDHAGYEMKNRIIEYLNQKSIVTKDFGTVSPESCDYADYAHQLANAIENKELKVGLAFCGSGNGINISLNRHKDVRSAYCWKPEIAELARQHNDANVCTVPARFLNEDEVIEIIEVFLATGFEGGRHQKRIEKIEITN